MSKKKIFGIVFILIGIILLIIPLIVRLKTDKTISTKVELYENKLKQIEVAKDSPLYTYLKGYNNSLLENGQQLKDAFSSQDTFIDLTSFGIENNVIGTLKIDKLNLYVPIYVGATDVNLNNGVCIISGTSMPLGEINSNVVIAGHRGLIRHQMFRRINTLENGDLINVNTPFGDFVYKVYDTKIILPDEIENIFIQKDRDIITLVTCHPYRVNTHRLLVYAERVQ
ncbi:MAG: class C sortase [Clostridia bacterium]|nr:class C sortase [Clostridia bacterium]